LSAIGVKQFRRGGRLLVAFLSGGKVLGFARHISYAACGPVPIFERYSSILHATGMSFSYVCKPEPNKIDFKFLK